MVELFSGLSAFLSREKITSCFIDTTILFSASYPLDQFNDEAEGAVNVLSLKDVPLFTNVNVRAEFLEAHRRVLIPECLCDFLQDHESILDGALLEKLKTHRKVYREKLREEKSAKMDINQIRLFRKMLSAYKSEAENGWEIFCRKYLSNKIELIWPETQALLNLHFISIRSSDENPHLNSVPQWEHAVSLMGRYGIGSYDAMILNMFLCSKIPVLLTADLEMAEVADKESKGSKRIFVPDSASVVAR